MTASEKQIKHLKALAESKKCKWKEDSESEYETWVEMRNRCNNPKNPAYKNYGGRGIKVCKEWDSFPRFIQDMGKRPEGLHLDRTDNNGNYEPGNCRWVERKINNRNKRDTIKITINNRTEPLISWCEELGLEYQTVYMRIRRTQCEPEEALYSRIFHHKKKLSPD